jgi:hypothetical protein
MSDYSNRAVTRALTVLDVLQTATRGMLLTEIATAVDLDRATVFRLLHVLTAHGYAHRCDATKRYNATARHGLRGRRELPCVVGAMTRSVLADLHAQTGAAVSLASLMGTEICYYQEFLGRDQIGTGAELFRGKRLPSHATACGKALMSGQTAAEIHRIFEYTPLHAYTQHTIRTVTDLKQSLWTVRETGYAINQNEFEPGRLCVATLVQTPTWMEPLSLSVSLSARKAEPGSIDALVGRLNRTGEQVAQILAVSGGAMVS